MYCEQGAVGTADPHKTRREEKLILRREELLIARLFLQCVPNAAIPMPNITRLYT